jgi:simple sugar transport system permease protein
VNGVLIPLLGITHILCKLGTQMLFTGLAVVLSDGRAVSVGSPEPISALGNGLVFAEPISFFCFVVFATIIGAVLRYTPFGQ